MGIRGVFIRNALLGCALLGSGCATRPIQRVSAVSTIGGGPGTSAATGASGRTAYVVPEPARLRSNELRCRERSIKEISYDATLDAAMSRVEAARSDARYATSKPIYLGVRACGPYRAVTLGDRFARTKLLYDTAGTLVAAFASSEVIEQKCLVDYDDATVHYGKSVDCTESELVFPAR